ncbi:MAG: ATP-binding protein [Synergistaceae bacterium]|nr:ATP-binding protein [Synergistaceae bacterium]
MRKYYGRLPLSDIAFFKSDDGKISVCIMEEAQIPNSNRSIIKAITEIFGYPVEVRLGYQKLDSDFWPEAHILYPKIDDGNGDDSEEIEKLSRNYQAEQPDYTFEQLVLPEATLEEIIDATARIDTEVKKKVFDEWGLRKIVPCATSAISFYGSPGTGKTMAAEAVASKLGKTIIRASYAEIESKYHGEGPKRVKAVFMAAEREDAVLFLDEADSLLSKRLTDVTEGSAQAINSMRSQLLISLEKFDGVVVFATNLVVNYDRAFISRLISIKIPEPDLEARKAIWEKHIHGEGISIPLSDDVDTAKLAAEYAFCGRDIKNAVVYACVDAARKSKPISQEDFLKACAEVKRQADEVAKASDYTQSTMQEIETTSEEKLEIADKLQSIIDSQENSPSP